ncbi:MAG: T9SS type A sorting domain-containing protein [Ignavibacteriaceae bacterium]|nr:T9SS type A sorting domain-containing protein [Ignavibacteriaceae bacterium]
MEVSPDGLTLYWTMFTGGMGIDIYTRPDELSGFVFSDSTLRGMSIETAAWNPATGNLWVSNDSRGTGPYSNLTWYEYNVTTKAIIDSFTLPVPIPGAADMFPRGLDFSPDGNTAYVGLFGTAFNRIYKFTKSAAASIYSEDFESGSADAGWYFYPNPSTGLPEEITTVLPMDSVPAALAGGGNFVGLLQDADGSYTGSAVSLNGDPTLTNYSIEADVYCYVGAAPSAYTGLVVYGDTTKKDFYKLRVDFDASDRINFSGRKTDPNTFLPLFNKDFKGVDNPGLFPTVSGWHKIKIGVYNTGAGETSFWCYFDGQLLAGCPVIDTTSTRNTAGSFGLYSFQQSASGLRAYYDNIVVNPFQAPTAIEDQDRPYIPEDISLAQNYPNPFNPSTNIIYNLKDAQNVSLIIYDVLGEKVKTLVSQNQSAGQYTVTWNGDNDLGNKVKSGIYIYTLKTNDVFVSKKMLMLK